MSPSRSSVTAGASGDIQEPDTSEDDHFSDASEGQQSDSASVPTTRVERVDDAPSHGEEPGTLAHEMRLADAAPDAVATAPEAAQTDQEEDMHFPQQVQEGSDTDDTPLDHSHGHDAADDDFDDFEQGDEADDFGTFDVGDDQRDATTEAPADTPKASLPLFDFDGLESMQDIAAASEPYLRELFPDVYESEYTEDQQLAEINPSFLTERSQSLWAQLVAPPPLQPPNWIRSRIRRLFLVSLGVPVDLDEILPASKQKKLILPSIEIESDSAPARTGEAAPLGEAAQKLKQHNASAASLTSTPSNRERNERKKRGPAPPPGLDLNAARLKCATTDAALKNLTAGELKDHVSMLNDYKERAGKLLEFWLIKKDSASGDKEAFEEVIENLVKHAKKIRE